MTAWAVAAATGRPGRSRRRQRAATPGEAGETEWHHRLKAGLERKWSKLDVKVKAQLKRWNAHDSAPNIFDILGNTIRIMEAQIAETQLAITRPEVLIQPDVGYLGFVEFNHAEEGIQAGYDAALPLLKAFLARRP